MTDFAAAMKAARAQQSTQPARVPLAASENVPE